MDSERSSTRAGDALAGRKAELRRTADVLVDVLIQNGVDVVFGLPGGAIAPIYDALLDRREIRVVNTKHEATAMFAAAGYARTTGKLGVVLTTSGPGVTNALTGLASAYCDGLPVLLIAGEVSRKVMGKGALQEGSAYFLDIVGMAKRIAKTAVQINESNAAPQMLRRAIATAMSGRRGPAVVTLPIDVASQTIRESNISTSTSTSFVLESWALARAADALQAGQRPLIFAGNGVRTAAGAARLREVAERLRCPVMTTPKAKGVFPEDHPLSLGVFGIGGHPSATEYLTGGIDVLLAIGTSLGELSTNGWTQLLTPKTEFIHVDIDANQIGKCYPANLSIVAPAEEFLRALRDRLPPRASREAPCRGVSWYESPEQIALATNRSRPITPQRALWEIQQILPPDTIFSCDVGEFSVFVTHYLKTTSPDGWILLNGLGSMGQAIGTAMGAKLARPDRTVGVICGDAGFAMMCPDIATLAAEKLPMTIFVMNDQRLGMVEMGMASLYGRTCEYPTGPIDVGTVALGLGARALLVESAGDLLGAAKEIAQATGPLVVDVRIDRDARMPKHGRFEALGKVTGNNAQKMLVN